MPALPPALPPKADHVPDPNLFDQDTPSPRNSPASQRGDGDDQSAPAARRVTAGEAEPAGATLPAEAYPDMGEPIYLPDPDDDETAGPIDARRYARISPPAGPARKLLVTFGITAVLLVVAVGGAYSWLQSQINPPGGPGDPVSLLVPSGSTVDDIASQLADEKIVSNPTVFRYYLRWKSIDSFQAGEYTLIRNSSFDDVIEVLQAGPAPEEFDRFTIAEGLTVAEITDRLASQIDGFDASQVPGALIRLRSPWRPLGIDSWEGLLFPDTYEYRVTDDAHAILERLSSQFDRVAREVGLDPFMNVDPDTLATNGLTAYQYIIIASMIEKEARLPEEHVMMSRVIHNRLELGMTLGIDATVIYARGPERTGPITDADLAIDSPYNTRLNPGLPPTPIAAPSRSALHAALNPADGDWIYYVLAGEDGSHFFTDDYDEFLRVRDESRAAGLF